MTCIKLNNMLLDMNIHILLTEKDVTQQFTDLVKEAYSRKIRLNKPYYIQYSKKLEEILTSCLILNTQLGIKNINYSPFLYINTNCSQAENMIINELLSNPNLRKYIKDIQALQIIQSHISSNEMSATNLLKLCLILNNSTPYKEETEYGYFTLISSYLTVYIEKTVYILWVNRPLFEHVISFETLIENYVQLSKYVKINQDNRLLPFTQLQVAKQIVDSKLSLRSLNFRSEQLDIYCRLNGIEFESNRTEKLFQLVKKCYPMIPDAILNNLFKEMNTYQTDKYAIHNIHLLMKMLQSKDITQQQKDLLDCLYEEYVKNYSRTYLVKFASYLIVVSRDSQLMKNIQYLLSLGKDLQDTMNLIIRQALATPVDSEFEHLNWLLYTIRNVLK